MPKITLTRSGDRPLVFHGDLIGQVESKRLNEKKGSRWYELELYHAWGTFVLSIVYRTTWQDEVDHHEAHILCDPEQVVRVLQTTDPVEWVRGYPPYPNWEKRQAALFLDLRSRYDAAVSELLAGFPEPLSEDVKRAGGVS